MSSVHTEGAQAGGSAMNGGRPCFCEVQGQQSHSSALIPNPLIFIPVHHEGPPVGPVPAQVVVQSVS